MSYSAPQCSILSPLLFIINLCDLFLSEYGSEFTNFADDNTLYECRKNYDKVISKLEYSIKRLCNWFRFNNFNAKASIISKVLSKISFLRKKNTFSFLIAYFASGSRTPSRITLKDKPTAQLTKASRVLKL